MLVITDLLTPPYDEGAKVVANNFINELQKITQNKFIIIKDKIHKLSVINKILSCSYKTILLIPSGSLSFNSFLKSMYLKILFRKKIYLISTIPSNYKLWQKLLLKYIQPDKIFVQTIKLKNELISYGLKNIFINKWGVDLNKFKPVSNNTKMSLRLKYNIPLSKTVYLHIGHLNKERNFNEMEPLLKLNSNNYILIVCSTSTHQESHLKDILSKNGFNFITDFIENIQELYQLSDYYVFPTKDKRSAIEFPLSVFEALACDIPVFHKNFGILNEMDNQFSNLISYIDPKALLKPVLSTKPKFPINNYSWEKITKDFYSHLDNQ